jgi:hypothetical protein
MTTRPWSTRLVVAGALLVLLSALVLSSTTTAGAVPEGPELVAPAGALESVVVCIRAVDCAALAGAPGDGTWQFAFDADTAGSFRVTFRRFAADPDGWDDATTVDVALSSSTAGVSVSDDRVTSDAARTVTVTVAPAGAALLDGIFWIELQRIAGDTADAAGTSLVTRSPMVGVFTTVGTSPLGLPGPVTVSHLIVAGGGQGGSRTNDLSSVTWAAGGGAGGMLVGTGVALSAGAHTVIVGEGGSGGTVASLRGVAGGDSVVGPLLAVGGGGGAASSSGAGTVNRAGGDGGSGGGGAHDGGVGAGGAGTAGQGNAGGDGFQPDNGSGGGGGGGGAGGAGAPGTLAGGGAGGAGLANGLTGTTVHYAGGGGGGPGTTGGQVSGAGGIGGGGASGSAGAANTGGGGGAGRRAGGSGLVVLRLTPDAPGGTFDADTSPSVQGGGEVRVGSVLVAPAVTWTGSPTTLRWNWQACDDIVQVPASCIEVMTTVSTLEVTEALAGRRIRVQAVATNPGGVTLLSSGFLADPVPAPAPGVGGSTDVGSGVPDEGAGPSAGPVPTAVPAGRPPGSLAALLALLTLPGVVVSVSVGALLAAAVLRRAVRVRAGSPRTGLP